MSTTPYDRGLCGEPGRRLGWTCGRPAGHQPPCMYPGGPPGDDGGPIILAWEPDCRQERDRFFGLDWTPWVRVGDEAPKPGWEASLFLGAGFDHPDADRYGAADRWLKVSGRTLAEAAAALVALLPGVTGTEVRP
jgi:hypothetical protein